MTDCFKNEPRSLFDGMSFLVKIQMKDLKKRIKDFTTMKVKSSIFTCAQVTALVLFSAVVTIKISQLFSYKTAQRTHHFCPKVNLLHDDGTKVVECAMENVINMLSAETIDGNDNIDTIHVPEPKTTNMKMHFWIIVLKLGS